MNQNIQITILKNSLSCSQIFSGNVCSFNQHLKPRKFFRFLVTDLTNGGVFVSRMSLTALKSNHFCAAFIMHAEVVLAVHHYLRSLLHYSWPAWLTCRAASKISHFYSLTLSARLSGSLCMAQVSIT